MIPSFRATRSSENLYDLHSKILEKNSAYSEGSEHPFEQSYSRESTSLTDSSAASTDSRHFLALSPPQVKNVLAKLDEDFSDQPWQSIAAYFCAADKPEEWIGIDDFLAWINGFSDLYAPDPYDGDWPESLEGYRPNWWADFFELIEKQDQSPQIEFIIHYILYAYHRWDSNPLNEKNDAIDFIKKLKQWRDASPTESIRQERIGLFNEIFEHFCDSSDELRLLICNFFCPMEDRTIEWMEDSFNNLVLRLRDVGAGFKEENIDRHIDAILEWPSAVAQDALCQWVSKTDTESDHFVFFACRFVSPLIAAWREDHLEVSPSLLAIERFLAYVDPQGDYFEHIENIQLPQPTDFEIPCVQTLLKSVVRFWRTQSSNYISVILDNLPFERKKALVWLSLYFDSTSPSLLHELFRELKNPELIDLGYESVPLPAPSSPAALFLNNESAPKNSNCFVFLGKVFADYLLNLSSPTDDQLKILKIFFSDVNFLDSKCKNADLTIFLFQELVEKIIKSANPSEIQDHLNGLFTSMDLFNHFCAWLLVEEILGIHSENSPVSAQQLAWSGIPPETLENPIFIKEFFSVCLRVMVLQHQLKKTSYNRWFIPSNLFDSSITLEASNDRVICIPTASLNVWMRTERAGILELLNGSSPSPLPVQRLLPLLLCQRLLHTPSLFQRDSEDPLFAQALYTAVLCDVIDGSLENSSAFKNFENNSWHDLFLSLFFVDGSIPIDPLESNWIPNYQLKENSNRIEDKIANHYLLRACAWKILSIRDPASSSLPCWALDADFFEMVLTTLNKYDHRRLLLDSNRTDSDSYIFFELENIFTGILCFILMSKEFNPTSIKKWLALSVPIPDCCYWINSFYRTIEDLSKSDARFNNLFLKLPNRVVIRGNRAYITTTTTWSFFELFHLLQHDQCSLFESSAKFNPLNVSPYYSSYENLGYSFEQHIQQWSAGHRRHPSQELFNFLHAQFGQKGISSKIKNCLPAYCLQSAKNALNASLASNSDFLSLLDGIAAFSPYEEISFRENSVNVLKRINEFPEPFWGRGNHPHSVFWKKLDSLLNRKPTIVLSPEATACMALQGSRLSLERMLNNPTTLKEGVVLIVRYIRLWDMLINRLSEFPSLAEALCECFAAGSFINLEFEASSLVSRLSDDDVAALTRAWLTPNPQRIFNHVTLPPVLGERVKNYISHIAYDDLVELTKDASLVQAFLPPKINRSIFSEIARSWLLLRFHFLPGPTSDGKIPLEQLCVVHFECIASRIADWYFAKVDQSPSLRQPFGRSIFETIEVFCGHRNFKAVARIAPEDFQPSTKIIKKCIEWSFFDIEGRFLPYADWMPSFITELVGKERTLGNEEWVNRSFLNTLSIDDDADRAGRIKTFQIMSTQQLIQFDASSIGTDLPFEALERMMMHSLEAFIPIKNALELIFSNDSIKQTFGLSICKKGKRLKELAHTWLKWNSEQAPQKDHEAHLLDQIIIQALDPIATDVDLFSTYQESAKSIYLKKSAYMEEPIRSAGGRSRWATWLFSDKKNKLRTRLNQDFKQWALVWNWSHADFTWLLNQVTATLPAQRNRDCLELLETIAPLFPEETSYWLSRAESRDIDLFKILFSSNSSPPQKVVQCLAQLLLTGRNLNQNADWVLQQLLNLSPKARLSVIGELEAPRGGQLLSRQLQILGWQLIEDLFHCDDALEAEKISCFLDSIAPLDTRYASLEPLVVVSDPTPSECVVRCLTQPIPKARNTLLNRWLAWWIQPEIGVLSKDLPNQMKRWSQFLLLTSSDVQWLCREVFLTSQEQPSDFIFDLLIQGYHASPESLQSVVRAGQAPSAIRIRRMVLTLWARGMPMNQENCNWLISTWRNKLFSKEDMIEASNIVRRWTLEEFSLLTNLLPEETTLENLLRALPGAHKRVKKEAASGSVEHPSPSGSEPKRRTPPTVDEGRSRSAPSFDQASNIRSSPAESSAAAASSSSGRASREQGVAQVFLHPRFAVQLRDLRLGQAAALQVEQWLKDLSETGPGRTRPNVTSSKKGGGVVWGHSHISTSTGTLVVGFRGDAERGWSVDWILPHNNQYENNLSTFLDRWAVEDSANDIVYDQWAGRPPSDE